MKAFFDGIPKELEEAAALDGCGALRTLARVTFPLASSGIAATSIFVFLLAWNEFMFAFMLTKVYARTIPVRLAETMGEMQGLLAGHVHPGDADHAARPARGLFHAALSHPRPDGGGGEVMGVLGVGGKGSSSGDKGNPPYPPLSGGYKKATPATGRGAFVFVRGV